MKIQTLKCLDASLGRMLTSLWPVFRAYPKVPKAPRRVLFIRPGGIGDAVLLIPAIRTFSVHFPECGVDVLAEKRNVQVFGFCQGIANVFCYDRPSDWLKVWRNHYDVVIDTEQWYRLSTLFGRLFGGQCLIGFGGNERKRLLSFAVDYDLDRYESISFLSLLEPWRKELPEKIKTPFLELGENGREKIYGLLENVLPGKFVAICPGGSRPEKSWGEAKFSKLAQRLAEKDVRCVILGGKDDATISERIALAGKGVSLAGKISLFETAVTLQESAVTVANDTGLLHLAVGLGRPAVGIFGPSSVKKWGPCGKDDYIFLNDCSCAPCSSFGVLPKCSNGFECMSGIDVVSVSEVVVAYCLKP